MKRVLLSCRRQADFGGVCPYVKRASECVSVLLATARVMASDQFGAHPARALVDSGSETSLIIEPLAQRLRLHRTDD